jgi:hypothetical protein
MEAAEEIQAASILHGILALMLQSRSRKNPQEKEVCPGRFFPLLLLEIKPSQQARRQDEN